MTKNLARLLPGTPPDEIATAVTEIGHAHRGRTMDGPAGNGEAADGFPAEAQASHL